MQFLYKIFGVERDYIIMFLGKQLKFIWTLDDLLCFLKNKCRSFQPKHSIKRMCALGCYNEIKQKFYQ